MNTLNDANQTCVSQHPFYNETDFIDYAATDHYVQPSAPLTDHKPSINTQPAYLKKCDSIKSNETGVLPSLPMLDTTERRKKILQENQ